MSVGSPFNFFQEYWIDAWQRSVLTLEALRERGNTFVERSSEDVPHVLGFAFEPILDGRDLAREVSAGRWRAELETRFAVGDLPEAVVRALMHVRLPSRTVDERGFAVLQAVRQILPANRRIGFDELKLLFRDQYLLVRLDEERAIRAIPRLRPDDPELRAAAWQVVQDILSASGSLTGGVKPHAAVGAHVCWHTQAAPGESGCLTPRRRPRVRVRNTTG